MYIVYRGKYRLKTFSSLEAAEKYVKELKETFNENYRIEYKED